MVEISDQLSFTPKAGQTFTNFMATYSQNVEGSGTDKEAFIKKRNRDRNENFGQPRITETTNGLKMKLLIQNCQTGASSLCFVTLLMKKP
ncbi:MAG: hypothetical protein CM15mP55_1060 [Hyphomicrobiales bacterium]|nr:MAG: hypothetical protein CM15mP55_1060 [Hyphomicrobiales bacterium]